jgi:integrase
MMKAMARRDFGSVRRLPSGKWQARHRDPLTGELVSLGTFRTKAEAADAVASARTDQGRGAWVDPRRGQVPFRELARHTEATRVNRRATTRARDATLLRTRVLPAFGERAVAEISPTDVRAWIAELEAAGLAPTTIRKCYQLVARVFDDAVEDGRIAVSPCRRIPLPKDERAKPQLLTPEQVDSLAEALPARYRALVVTAAYTGLRWGELAGLKLTRVDFLRRKIDVAEILTEVDGALTFGPPKTAKSRARVSFPPFLANVLAAHVAAFPDPDRSRRLVFTSEQGDPLRRSNFRRRVWLPALEATGLPSSTHFHATRHATASWLIDAGANPLEVAERLRHARIATTLGTYGHLFPGTDEKLDDILEGKRPKNRGSEATSSPV